MASPNPSGSSLGGEESQRVTVSPNPSGSLLGGTPVIDPRDVGITRGSGGNGSASDESEGCPVYASSPLRRLMLSPSTSTHLMSELNAVGDGEGPWSVSSSSSSSGGLDLGPGESHYRRCVDPEASPTPNRVGCLLLLSPVGSPPRTDDDVLSMDGVLVDNNDESGTPSGAMGSASLVGINNRGNRRSVSLSDLVDNNDESGTPFGARGSASLVDINNGGNRRPVFLSDLVDNNDESGTPSGASCSASLADINNGGNRRSVSLSDRVLVSSRSLGSSGGERSSSSDKGGFQKQSRRLLHSSVRCSPEFNVDFYEGPEIFNTVTWNLNGSPEQVTDGQLYATGHQRLWNLIKGKVLDITSIYGSEMIIFTTAEEGTFFFTVTDDEDYVTLQIDGREAWNYSFINRFGCFEYDHPGALPYVEDESNWFLLDKCFGDYSPGGLCPDGHNEIALGIPAARRACKTLSMYKGELPVPPNVRRSCATLLTYSTEATKFNEVLELCSSSLKDGVERTLGSLNPTLSPIIKKWSVLGKSKLDYFSRVIKDGRKEHIGPLVPRKTGLTEEGALNAVCVIAYNNLIPEGISKTRTWTSHPLDIDSHLGAGLPHHISKEFARPWPFHKLGVIGHPNRVINPLSIARNARVQKKQHSSGPLFKSQFRNARQFSSCASTAMRLIKFVAK